MKSSANFPPILQVTRSGGKNVPVEDAYSNTVYSSPVIGCALEQVGSGPIIGREECYHVQTSSVAAFLA